MIHSFQHLKQCFKFYWPRASFIPLSLTGVLRTWCSTIRRPWNINGVLQYFLEFWTIFRSPNERVCGWRKFSSEIRWLKTSRVEFNLWLNHNVKPFSHKFAGWIIFMSTKWKRTIKCPSALFRLDNTLNITNCAAHEGYLEGLHCSEHTIDKLRYVHNLLVSFPYGEHCKLSSFIQKVICISS